MNSSPLSTEGTSRPMAGISALGSGSSGGYSEDVDKIEVVVVDASKVMRQLIQSALRPLTGMRVTVYEDPVTAYADAIERLDNIGLFVTEFRMRAMDGKRLADALHSQASDLPVICVSGCDPDEIDRTPFVDFIRKPFETRTIQRSVMRHMRLPFMPAPVKPLILFS